MSEQEKAKLIEDHLPTVEEVIDEYRAQGKELTRQEAEKICERLRADLAAGRVDAMENVLGDDVLEKIAGGALVPSPTLPHTRTPTPIPTYYPRRP
ncbi:MAG: hypothetical protein J5835_07675 [Bacteroidales bacterium]|nr:hypothetical protein [Bacteroidales bacterium]